MLISPVSSLKKTKSENVPPVSTVTRYLAIVFGCSINLSTVQRAKNLLRNGVASPARIRTSEGARCNFENHIMNENGFMSVEGRSGSSGVSIHRAELIILLGAISAFASLSVDTYLPALPTLEKVFDASSIEVQLTLASFFVAFALGQAFYGPIIDRFGRKRPLCIALMFKRLRFGLVHRSAGCDALRASAWCLCRRSNRPGDRARFVRAHRYGANFFRVDSSDRLCANAGSPCRRLRTGLVGLEGDLLAAFDSGHHQFYRSVFSSARNPSPGSCREAQGWRG